MDPSKFGPFANIVGLACALVAMFSVLLLKMLGNIRRWTFLTADSPSFLVTAGARMLAVALMAVTYVTIDRSNYIWFGVAAAVCGLLGFLSVARFDLLRKQHVVKIPLVGDQGEQLADSKGNLQYARVVVGKETDLNSQAKADLEKARKKHGGVSLTQFMSGYGANKVNDPEALWDRPELAKISSRLTVTLMSVVLFAVITIFLAAFVIEVGGRSS